MSCEFELFGEVIPQESKRRKTGRELYLSIKKKEEGPYWPRLTTHKLPYVKIDFNRWKDEDDSEEDEDQFEDGLENLMQRMDVGKGGGGNPKFDPGDFQSSDSDDEELPDLES